MRICGLLTAKAVLHFVYSASPFVVPICFILPMLWGGEFQLQWLWQGIPYDRRHMGPDSLEYAQHVDSAVLLAMISLITAPGLFAVAWMQAVPLTPGTITLQVLPLVYGLMLFISSRITGARPYISVIAAIVQVLQDANLLVMFHVISSSSPTVAAGGSNEGCNSLMSQMLAAIANSQCAWFGYCNILTGYTRCGALSMLMKPFTLAVLVFASPTFSTDAWYLLVGMSPRVCSESAILAEKGREPERE